MMLSLILDMCGLAVRMLWMTYITMSHHPCVLWATYVAKLNLYLCAIGDIYVILQIVLFKLAGALHLNVIEISHDITRNQTKTGACILKVSTRSRRIWSLQSFFLRNSDFMVSLGANTIKHAYEVELFIISAILEKFLWRNRIVSITKYQQVHMTLMFCTFPNG